MSLIKIATHLIVLLSISMVSTHILAQTHVWDGSAGDGLWSSATNWNTNSVPGVGNHVKIDDNAIVHVDIDVTIASVHSLGTSGTTPGTLIIDAGITLTTTNRGLKIQNASSSLVINGTYALTHADAGYHGIDNAIGATMTVSSTGSITISDVANGMGIYQNGGVFTNDGVIAIDNITVQAGINIAGGTMTNNGIILFDTNIVNVFALQGNIDNTSSSTISGNSTTTTAVVNTDVSFDGGIISPNSVSTTGRISFRSGLTITDPVSFQASVANNSSTLTSDELYFFNGGAANFDISNIDLVLSDIGGSALQIGDVFTLVDSQFGYSGGAFNSVDTSVPTLPATSAWSLSYLTNSVTIEIISILPVSLDYFVGISKNNQIQLDWQTRSEANNDRFEVEKSNNAREWKILAKIQGNGTVNETRNYHFADTRPLHGANYYRLRQVDYDGQFEYSDMISVWHETQMVSITVSPNPTSSSIKINSIEESYSQPFQIISIDGKLALDTLPLNRDIDISHLASGIYLLIGNQIQERIVIE